MDFYESEGSLVYIVTPFLNKTKQNKTKQNKTKQNPQIETIGEFVLIKHWRFALTFSAYVPYFSALYLPSYLRKVRETPSTLPFISLCKMESIFDFSRKSESISSSTWLYGETKSKIKWMSLPQKFFKAV